MIIRSKDYKNSKFPEVRLNGKKIDECCEIKYLGHIMSSYMSDDVDIMRHCRYLYAIGNICIHCVYTHSVYTYTSISFPSSYLYLKNKYSFFEKKLFNTHITNFHTMAAAIFGIS